MNLFGREIRLGRPKLPRIRREPELGELLGDANDLVEGDKLGVWPTEKRTGDRDRGTRVALRFSVFLNGTLVMALLLCLSIIDHLTPLRRDVPVGFEIRGYDRSVAQIQPIQMQGRWQEVVLELEVARYVRVRHEIVGDLAEMDRRWGRKCVESDAYIGFAESDLLCSYMYRHTEPKEYVRFAKEVQAVKQFIEEGKTRRVKILGDPLRKDNGLYEVRYALQDIKAREVRQQGYNLPGEPEVVRERRFKALVWLKGVGFNGQRRERHLNPFGLTVMKYEWSEDADGGADAGGGRNQGG